MATRITQIVSEGLVPADPNARVTQVTSEALVPGNPNNRVTQVVSEAHVAPAAGPNVRVTQIAIESFVSLAPVGLDVGTPRASTRTSAPAMLLDIQTSNNTVYFWGSHQGGFPARLLDTEAQYFPYLISAGPFGFTRTLRADAGEIVVQNISGNLIERDVMKILRDDEFEGALAIFRLYDWIAGVRFEFHGTLSAPEFDQTKASFKITQIFDTNSQNIPFRQYSSVCTRIYKSPRCGSTGTATMCPKTVPACKDPRRAAFHRFDGVSFSPFFTQISPIQYVTAIKPGLISNWKDRRSSI